MIKLYESINQVWFDTFLTMSIRASFATALRERDPSLEPSHAFVRKLLNAAGPHQLVEFADELLKFVVRLEAFFHLTLCLSNRVRSVESLFYLYHLLQGLNYDFKISVSDQFTLQIENGEQFPPNISTRDMARPFSKYCNVLGKSGLP